MRLLEEQQLQTVSHALQEPTQLQRDPQSVPSVLLDRGPVPTLILPPVYPVQKATIPQRPCHNAPAVPLDPKRVSPRGPLSVTAAPRDPTPPPKCLPARSAVLDRPRLLLLERSIRVSASCALRDTTR